MKTSLFDSSRNILILGFSLLILITTIGWSSENVPEQVLKAAEVGLEPFLNAIPASEITHYGFSNSHEIKGAYLGKPIKMYTILPKNLITDNFENQLSSIVTATNQWFFPVKYKNSIKTILTVDLVSGKWKAVAIGSSGLAKQLEEAKVNWPATKGYKFQFVRIFQAQSDLLIITQNNVERIFPLKSTVIALKMENLSKENLKLYDPQEILTKLKPIVYKNIQF